mgnify:CR=1 FL=1
MMKGRLFAYTCLGECLSLQLIVLQSGEPIAEHLLASGDMDHDSTASNTNYCNASDQQAEAQLLAWCHNEAIDCLESERELVAFYALRA